MIALLVLFAVVAAAVLTDAIGTITLLNRQVQLQRQVCTVTNDIYTWEQAASARAGLPRPLIQREHCHAPR